MKRIFLIGDSIRIGYDRYVRENLAGKALVYWNEDNARFVQYTLRYIGDWVKEQCDPEAIDIVHWNNGLWDILHQFGDECMVSPEDYEKYLRRIIKRLRIVFPNAKICFALTTQVVEEFYVNPAFCRSNQENIPVDDLYTVSAQMPRDWHNPDGTHFMPEGYQELARAVTAFLEEQM